MTPEEVKRIEACIQEIAEILYKNTPRDSLRTLEDIEKIVRQQSLEYVNPKIALFFIEKVTITNFGRKRKLKTCLGHLSITKKQAERLGLKPYTRLSPMLEKCCFLLSAN